MSSTGSLPPTRNPSPLDRLLRVFGDVRAQEGGRVVLMFLNIFTLLVSYYIIKTVREPLILHVGGTGVPGAELKTYAAAAQALTLIVYIPLYGWVASRLPRLKLIVAVYE
jgi:AAA family ATP:ADP antiporter